MISECTYACVLTASHSQHSPSVLSPDLSFYSFIIPPFPHLFFSLYPCLHLSLLPSLLSPSFLTAPLRFPSQSHFCKYPSFPHVLFMLRPTVLPHHLSLTFYLVKQNFICQSWVPCYFLQVKSVFSMWGQSFHSSLIIFINSRTAVCKE